MNVRADLLTGRLGLRLYVCAAITALMAANGCAKPAVRTEGVTQLEMGMSRAQVLSIMGEAQIVETYGNMEVLFFRGEHSAGPEDLIPVLIVDGRLAGWGRVAYESATRSKTVPQAKAP